MGLLPLLLSAMLLAPQVPADAPAPAVAVETPFPVWLEQFTQDARDRGFDDALLAATLGTLEPLPRVVALDRNQAELVLTFNQYYRSRVTPLVVRRGRAMAREHRALLKRIEATYGVPSSVVLAIWGLESRYGRNSGRTPVFRALATLAWEPRRSAFFRDQLFDALTIVSSGAVEAGAMTGSWAGAMGQPQFMPSSYLAHAVDFDGDGRRDIWRSTPDTLASIASYLRDAGWVRGQTWGREVRVGDAARETIQARIPPRSEGCYAERNMTERRPLNEWARIGVRTSAGTSLPRAAVPAGLTRVLGDRTFLLYPNYDALLAYNCAHHYALSVALLSERLR